jgi:hypothetical protein
MNMKQIFNFSKLFVNSGIDSFVGLTRKSINGLKKRLHNSENVLVINVVKSLNFMYAGNLNRKWISVLT